MISIGRTQGLVNTQGATRSAAIGAGLLFGLALNAFAQTAAPAPSPFEAPHGAPPVTSTSANGRLGAAPIAPRVDGLTPPPPVDAAAAEAAAAHGTAPVESVKHRKNEKARTSPDHPGATR